MPDWVIIFVLPWAPIFVLHALSCKRNGERVFDFLRNL